MKNKSKRITQKHTNNTNLQIKNIVIKLKAIQLLSKVLDIEQFNAKTKNLDAVYRNQINKLDKIQQAWFDYFLKDIISVQLTITLPRKSIAVQGKNKSITKYKLSKNQYKCVDDYHELTKLFLETYACSQNNWPRKAFNFKGVIEQGNKDDPSWHSHFLIQNNTDDKIGFLYRLCWTIQKLKYEYGFPDNVFDIKSIYDEAGICNYLCKELTQNKNLNKNEGSYPFTLYTWFKIKDEKIKSLKFHPIYKLRILIYFGLYLKVREWFRAFIPNPIKKLLVIDKRHYRRKFKVNMFPDFDPLDLAIQVA